VQHVTDHFINTVTLTHEQQLVCDYLTPFFKEAAYKPTVLHGVTGSGKTEVYKQLIVQAINNKKAVLLMLPEVTLAVQFYNVLKKTIATRIANSNVPFRHKHQRQTTTMGTTAPTKTGVNYRRTSACS